MSSTIFYPATSVAYDAAILTPFDLDQYPTAYALNSDLGDKWGFTLSDVGAEGTSIDFRWDNPVNTFVGGPVRGFAKSALLHVVWDTDYPGAGPADPLHPTLVLSALWDQPGSFSPQGLFAERPIATLVTTDTIELASGVMELPSPDPDPDHLLRHLTVPVDLTLDEYLPILRFRYLPKPGGYSMDLEQHIIAVYLEIDWASDHGFTAKWPTRAEWVSSPSGLLILSAGDPDSAFNPDTGAWRKPTAGNPVGFKSWSDPANPGVQTFVPVTEFH